jgi:general secretion pathway protein I
MRGDQRGFTLLEVLIAFAITAIALTVLYRGGLEGLLSAKQAARINEAVSRARSRLAVACHGQAPTPGVRSGDDGGGFSWRTETIREATKLIAGGDDARGAPASRADLLTVRVTVSWPGGVRQRDVTLVTQCVTTGPPERP